MDVDVHQPGYQPAPLAVDPPSLEVACDGGGRDRNESTVVDRHRHARLGRLASAVDQRDVVDHHRIGERRAGSEDCGGAGQVQLHVYPPFH